MRRMIRATAPMISFKSIGLRRDENGEELFGCSLTAI